MWPGSKLKCPICGSADSVAFSFRRDSNAVHHCGACEVEFLFPQPSDEVLSSIYTSDYFLGSRTDESIQRQGNLKRRTAQLYLDAIAPYVQTPHPRLLELGCGSGDFLIEAQSRGFLVEGLEYSQHAANVANSRLGKAAVRVGSPDADEFPVDAYDVIAASDVIEHLRDPLRALRNLHPALKKGGLLVLVTPSLDSWSRRLLGHYWMEYKTEHLIYFGRKSLRRALESSNFNVIRFFPNYKILDFDYISAHFDRFPVPVLSLLVRTLRNLTPHALAFRPVKIPPSGMMAVATKR